MYDTHAHEKKTHSTMRPHNNTLIRALCLRSPTVAKSPWMKVFLQKSCVIVRAYILCRCMYNLLYLYMYVYMCVCVCSVRCTWLKQMFCLSIHMFVKWVFSLLNQILYSRSKPYIHFPVPAQIRPVHRKSFYLCSRIIVNGLYPGYHH